jgi:cysteine-rich repeat protein
VAAGDVIDALGNSRVAVTRLLLAHCGDGVHGGDEGCDDGNPDDGDGCDTNCTPTACGNGIVTAGEQCDDGNVVDGDGCSTVTQTATRTATHTWTPSVTRTVTPLAGQYVEVQLENQGDAVGTVGFAVEMANLP